MDRESMLAFAKEYGKSIKSETDLYEFTSMLSKVAIEAALNAEMDEHLGYEKHAKSDSSNARNGYTSKTLRTEDGQFELKTPRDRDGQFEPKLVKKNQTRFDSVNQKILHLYAKGMTTREISETLKELYDADVSPTVIS